MTRKGKGPDAGFAVMSPTTMTKDLRDCQTKGNQSQKTLAGNLLLDGHKGSLRNSAAFLPLMADLKNLALK
jgi:hypothetical protein